MKGLLLKEFYTMKRYRNTFLLYLLLFGGMAIFTGSIGMYSVMAVLFMTSIPLSSFNIDEACRWDKMAIASPISRRQIVASKYLLMLICALFSIISAVAVVGIGTLVRPEQMDFLEGLISVAAGIGVMGTMMMILLPILFKVGAEKGRMMMALIFGGSFAVIMIGVMIMEVTGIIGRASTSVENTVVFTSLVVVPVIALIGAFISYRVSCAIYAKREL